MKLTFLSTRGKAPVSDRTVNNNVNNHKTFYLAQLHVG